MAQRVPARLTASAGRRFGLTVGVAFLALGALLLWRDRELGAAIAGSVGGILALAGLVAPTRLGPIERGWMAFAHAISKVTTPIFMGIVYYVTVVPIGLGMRLFRRNPLTRDEADGGFWIAREADDDARRGGMHRQF